MNMDSSDVEEYDRRFLVMASGETSDLFNLKLKG